ncbi:MAG: hypothetical protein ACLSHC_12900 [Bilophila wadsworthia]
MYLQNRAAVLGLVLLGASCCSLAWARWSTRWILRDGRSAHGAPGEYGLICGSDYPGPRHLRGHHRRGQGHHGGAAAPRW